MEEVALTTSGRAVPRSAARDALLLVRLGAALLGVRTALRGVGIPGHAAAPALFFLVLGRSLVPRRGAALAVAATTGLASALGVAGGPGGAAALLLAAAVVDGAGLLRPDFVTSLPACAGIGALAGAARLLPALAMVAAGGLHAGGAPPVLSGLAHAAFGALGATLVPLVRGRRSGRAAGRRLEEPR
jgi:hypothetical protein